MAEIPRMVTIKEAAKATGLAEHHVRQLVLSGRVVAVKAGKKYLVNLDRLIEYLNTAHVGDDMGEQYGKIRPVDRRAV
ncbi:helix-turn-helix domain-containing protein [Anaerotruncus rubiinfantis]|uniref:helix-turn-helix domain-containing protein n=1 Tax=Anaerotruncus rubiinfantis TaxID=1720200 RepID=UPI0009ACD021|nr:helix-turn-helix domain-containing protein [Anaerotruncus rubiinfantis]